MVGQRRIDAWWIALAFVALIGSSMCAALAIASSSLTPDSERLRSPRQYLSAALTTEPARSVGGLLLSTGAFAFVLAALARKLELDLRRVQLPRKEAPIGVAPTVCDDWIMTENLALCLHCVAAVGALGASAIAFDAHPRANRAFLATFFVGGSMSAALHAIVDHGLGNTCSERVRLSRAVFAGLALTASTAFVVETPSPASESDEFARLAARAVEFAQLTCVAALCAHYVTWVRSFRSFTVVASAADVHTGMSRDSSWAWGLRDGERGGESDDDDGEYSVAELGEASSKSSGASLVSKLSEMLGGSGRSSPKGNSRGNSQRGRVDPFGLDRPYSPARVSGLRSSPMTPGVPRVDSSDRIYRQLHEPFMRAHMEHQEQRQSNLGKKLPFVP